MTKAVKCQACGLYYNGQVYQECPHCKLKQEAEKENFREIAPAENLTQTDLPAEISPHRKSANSIQRGRRTVGYDKIQTGSKPAETDAAATADMQKSRAETDEPQRAIPEPQEKPVKDDLREQLKKSGKTIGKFTSSGSEKADPVVGWIVGVKGTYYGQSFILHSGKNKVGRSQEFDVRLLNDESVSRTCVAEIIFDTRANEFSIIPGNSDSLCYINGAALHERKILTGYEQIELGDSEKNMFVFIPLCGERFNWNSYRQ